MAWLGRVSLGGFPDLAGAVTKLSESVKNIEKNFDSALGLEDKSETGEASGIWPSASDTKSLFNPVMSFIGHKAEDDTKDSEASEELKSTDHPSADYKATSSAAIPSESDAKLDVTSVSENRATEPSEEVSRSSSDTAEPVSDIPQKLGDEPQTGLYTESSSPYDQNIEPQEPEGPSQHHLEVEIRSATEEHNKEADISVSETSPPVDNSVASPTDELHSAPDVSMQEEAEAKLEQLVHKGADDEETVPDDSRRLINETEAPSLIPSHLSEGNESFLDSHNQSEVQFSTCETVGSPSSPSESESAPKARDMVQTSPSKQSEQTLIAMDADFTVKDSPKKSVGHGSDSVETLDDVDKIKREMKMMEAALQGAARQSQSKADEIAKLMNENEQLKSTIEELQKKSVEAENDALREEYHQRVSSLERKVYALTKERDTLRREQNKRSDVAALLKEKDEIITQVMAEGENLSKKQANQEATIRKLRAQIRELEEEKQRLNSKLQVEETKVESMKKDKAATEKLLQETIEKNQAELSAQKEYYVTALKAAKEAEEMAEARANNEAKAELENRLREASEREAMLIQTLEELRQTLSRTERQAVFREEMLQKDIAELQNRYQASELRYNELITQVPESTRPLLRQIEAMQEAAARKAEAWAGVEKSLNSRLEAAEAKASASEEKERLMNDRLSQTLSRMAVLETQITCLRTEQTQLSRTLEKERQRASESRQEYLAAMEEAATHEGRAKQLEEEIRELRTKHKQELQEQLINREILEKELEREKLSRQELERNRHVKTTSNPGTLLKATLSIAENGNVPARKFSSVSSLSSVEDFLQASLDSSDSAFTDRRTSGEASVSPYFLKSMTPSAFEAALRQKDGELSSYLARLESLESIRDNLAEELVKMTAQCEKLRAEASLVPGIRAELEALRRRHSSALELMGERDEELEELRADIIDLKEMYREQVDLLVNKIQIMTSSVSVG